MSFHPPYTLHPAISYGQAIIDHLPERTGRTIDSWIDLVRAADPVDDAAARRWLKSEFGLGGTTANLVVSWALGDGRFAAERYPADARAYVDALYSGKRTHLRPLHDRLIRLALDLGPELRISPARTIVPLYRDHVIAHIRPTTQTRIDLGLALKGYAGSTEELLETGGLQKGDRITHRIPISKPADVDEGVARWLAAVYELDAP